VVFFPSKIFGDCIGFELPTPPVQTGEPRFRASISESPLLSLNPFVISLREAPGAWLESLLPNDGLETGNLFLAQCHSFSASLLSHLGCNRWCSSFARTPDSYELGLRSSSRNGSFSFLIFFFQANDGG